MRLAEEVANGELDGPLFFLFYFSSPAWVRQSDKEHGRHGCRCVHASSGVGGRGWERVVSFGRRLEGQIA